MHDIQAKYDGTCYSFRQEPTAYDLPADEATFYEVELAGNFDCTLAGLPAGDYVLELWLRKRVYDDQEPRLLEIAIDGTPVAPPIDFRSENGLRSAFRETYAFRASGAPVHIRLRNAATRMSLFRLVVRDRAGKMIFADSLADRMRAFGDTLGTKDQILHAIGNAHLDPVWQWRWQEGCAEAIATIRSALDRMDEYPDFKFTCSSAQFFAWLEQLAPDMMDEVRRRVAEGRWEVVGGWWIQPDCNLPSGEGFVRHSLYGQRFFRRVLGESAVTGYNVDSFGHAATLPQILAKSGMTNYVFMRPQPGQKHLPAETFWWEGPDGSRVLACRLPLYNSEDVAPNRLAIFPVVAADYPCKDHRPYFFGVGNHGGGPTVRQIEGLMALDRDDKVPRIQFSTTEAMFQGMRDSGATFPVVRDDLQHHAPGCYTTHSGLKRMARQTENLLLAAERFDTVASVLEGVPAATARIESAWRDGLFNHFHDIMGGASLLPACDDALAAYGRAISEAESVLNAALRRLAARVDTRGPGTPVLFFNPTARPRREVIEAGFIIAGGRVLRDENDRVVPVQTRLVDGARHYTFEADVPPLGYRLYHLVAREAPRLRNPLRVNRRKLTIANGHLSLRVDRKTGAIAELMLGGCDINFAGSGTNVGLVLEDTADAWGHNTTQWTNVLGTFKPRSIQVQSVGPVRATIRVEASCDSARARWDISLAAGARHVDVELLLDCHRPRRMFKLLFDTPFPRGNLTASAPYGFIERPRQGAEDPCQTWIDFSDERAGVAVVNDSKFGYDVVDSAIRLTAARTVPYVGSPDRFHDIGEQRIRYRLIPHRGAWQDAGVSELATSLNEPLIVVHDYAHPGDLPASSSFAACECENALLSVLKFHEDGGDLIIRLVETKGRTARPTVALPFIARSLARQLHPHEIATFRIPRDPTSPIVETDLIETPACHPNS